MGGNTWDNGALGGYQSIPVRDPGNNSHFLFFLFYSFVFLDDKRNLNYFSKTGSPNSVSTIQTVVTPTTTPTPPPQVNLSHLNNI
jgi:hypothetical protein